jgi:hypothetical protein
VRRVADDQFEERCAAKDDLSLVKLVLIAAWRADVRDTSQSERSSEWDVQPLLADRRRPRTAAS